MSELAYLSVVVGTAPMQLESGASRDVGFLRIGRLQRRSTAGNMASNQGRISRRTISRWAQRAAYNRHIWLRCEASPPEHRSNWTSPVSMQRASEPIKMIPSQSTPYLYHLSDGHTRSIPRQGAMHAMTRIRRKSDPPVGQTQGRAWTTEALAGPGRDG